MANNAELQNFKKGEIIFKQGTFDMCMYDIVEGIVGIYLNYGEKNQKLLSKLRAGQSFGEIGLVGVRARSATAVALEPVSVNMIDSDTFETFFKDNPEKVLTIMQNMGKRICELTDDYVEACRATAEAVAAEKDQVKKNILISKFGKFLDVYYQISGHDDRQ